MIVRLLAAVALALALWHAFRLAMGLRYAKRSREQARSAEEARGRRVVAEIPTGDEGLAFFLEDAEGFYWGASEARKPEVLGARLLLNGGVMGACVRDAVALPAPPAAEEYEGGERWEVALHLAGGRCAVVPCGSLREGVSREIAGRVFEAVRRAVTA